MIGMVGANGAGKSTLINALAGWSRGAPQVRGKVQLAGQIDGRAAAASPRRARAGPGAGRQGHLRRPHRHREPRAGAAAARHDRPPRLLDGGDLRAVPPAGRTARPQGRHAVGRRTPDGGGEPRAARRAARAAARRAVGRAGAAARLRAARHDARAGRSRPVAAAGRAERARHPRAGRRALSARARQGRRRGAGGVDEATIRASSKPISEASPHEPRAAAHQRPGAGLRLRADRDRLDGAAGRGAPGELRPWPALHAGRLHRLGGDDQARRRLLRRRADRRPGARRCWASSCRA